MASAGELRRNLIGWITVAVILIVLTISASLVGAARNQSEERIRTARDLTGGDVVRGKDLIANVGCASCHTIPHIAQATALVGPPLEKIASRVYIGGVLQNTPDNLQRWLKDPPGVDPLTAMPNLHLSDDDVRDIAAYLYTLQ
jgi:cytochrome c